MDGELEALREASFELAHCAASRSPEVAGRAQRLGERLGWGRFHVSVIGEFKRGKSTLIDALVGEAVLPTGAIPLTALATEVSYGTPGATVVYLDGTTRELEAGDNLAGYVTEIGNPGNAAQVARVEVRVLSSLLETGLVLVDTPGIGSVHLHNDEAAEQAVLDGDGAIVVLSVDAPLSERERAMVAALSERQVPMFFVVNKADHLDDEELEQVRGFIAAGLEAVLGTMPRVWHVAALPGLRSRQAGEEVGPGCGELAGFEAELRRFVKHDLQDTRLVTARRELARLAGEMSISVEIAGASLAMSAAALAERVEAFRAAAAAERQALSDDRTLLDRDVAALSERVGADLAAFARSAPAELVPELERIAEAVPVSRLEDELQGAVEYCVRSGFEQFRREEARVVESAWQEMAVSQRSRVQARVNALRSAAADLFDVTLPTVTVPEVSEERERFFYLFVQVGSTTEGIGRVARRVLPAGIARRHLLDRAAQQLRSELDKHAGRARWDLSQRLDSVRRRFEVTVERELDQTISTVLGAAERADEMRRETEQQRQRKLAEDEAMLRVAGATLALCGQEA
ncbi:MAG: dynamin family protein [Acidimicrobiales bacterium]